jgi:CubicO group peptidase (beta-lactamase class C family)
MNLLEGFEKSINNAMATWKVPGCAVTIVKGNEVLLAKGYGNRRSDFSEPVDAHTLFPIASLTKPFMAAAMGILAQGG